MNFASTEIGNYIYIYFLDGKMNDSMKQNIRGKTNTYIKRAEELKKLLDKTPTPAKSTVPSEGSQDTDTVRMMQKFQGQSYSIYSSHINIILSR
jgi:hypothetical protein